MGIPFEKHSTSVDVRPAFSIMTAKPVNMSLSKLSNHAIGSVSVSKNYVFRHTNLTVEGSFAQATHLASAIS